MTKKSRIVLVEDHTILREGLRSLLSSDPRFEVVGEAEDGLEAIQCIDKLAPDLVLMDLTMPKMDGLGAIRETKNRQQNTKVLVLTVHKTEEYILAALQAGADGYVLKDATQTELIRALEAVIGGQPYLSPEVSHKVINGYLESKKSNYGSSIERLTERERQILKMIGEGYRNKEIGDQLSVSVKTVEKHRANLMKKLDLHNTAALTAYAIEKGLLSA
jgi:DNA-binding NarL/FixJ family response regulator